MQTTRLYRIKCKSSDRQRLVAACSPQAARSFVARDEYSVDIPVQHEVFAMAKAGIEIEVITSLSDATSMAVAQTCIEG